MPKFYYRKDNPDYRYNDESGSQNDEFVPIYSVDSGNGNKFPYKATIFCTLMCVGLYCALPYLAVRRALIMSQLTKQTDAATAEVTRDIIANRIMLGFDAANIAYSQLSNRHDRFGPIGRTVSDYFAKRGNRL